MLFGGKPLEAITETDLQALVAEKVVEQKTVDYKQLLSVAADRDKSEFIRDVSSFANSQGGFLFYGIKEEAGVPTEVCGCDVADADALKLQLDSIIRNHTKPRVTGVNISVINLANGKSVVVIHIPKGWGAPHMVSFNEDYRFYGRATNGRYRLDVDELRNVFAQSAALADRIRNFRLERIAKVIEGQTPAPLMQGGIHSRNRISRRWACSLTPSSHCCPRWRNRNGSGLVNGLAPVSNEHERTGSDWDARELPVTESPRRRSCARGICRLLRLDAKWASVECGRISWRIQKRRSAIAASFIRP